MMFSWLFFSVYVKKTVVHYDLNNGNYKHMQHFKCVCVCEYRSDPACYALLSPAEGVVGPAKSSSTTAFKR